MNEVTPIKKSPYKAKPKVATAEPTMTPPYVGRTVINARFHAGTQIGIYCVNSLDAKKDSVKMEMWPMGINVLYPTGKEYVVSYANITAWELKPKDE